MCNMIRHFEVFIRRLECTNDGIVNLDVLFIFIVKLSVKQLVSYQKGMRNDIDKVLLFCKMFAYPSMNPFIRCLIVVVFIL